MDRSPHFYNILVTVPSSRGFPYCEFADPSLLVPAKQLDSVFTPSYDDTIRQFLDTKLNTADTRHTPDEDRYKRSDVGNMTERLETATKNEPSKKSRLLANPDIRRWHDNLARGSTNTAEVRLRKLGKFCEDHGMTPMQLAELAMRDQKAATDLLEDHVTQMEGQGKAPQYIKATITSVKSWLYHWDVEIRRKIRISNVDSTPTLQNERVPEADELAELFSRAGLRQGAIMALMSKSGLRPEVLGNHDATDGLAIKDMPDLAIVQGLATFANPTPKINVRRTLSKAGHSYFTFLTGMGAKRVLAYLNDRILRGDVLAPESPVIAPSHLTRRRGGNEGKRFVTTAVIEKDVRDAMRPRFAWRPYVLRAFFDTQLLIAESHGRIAHDFRVFFMGHKGSIEAKYTTNKGILPKGLVDEMRDAFVRSQESLDLEGLGRDPLEARRDEAEGRIRSMRPDELARVLELLDDINGGNTGSRSSR
ncbi:MAG: hypothetical protein KGI33_07485 [Thaumarchaeota archaeon]|nr:hypothetical protein [Nitrososphaerota archaeon]